MRSRIRKVIETVFRGTKQKRLSSKIEGVGNLIQNSGSLHQVSFDIKGNHNHISIGSGCNLFNFKFYIRGDHHRIVIGENCRIKGGDCWIEDKNCEIIIGKETTIESAHLAVTEPYKKIQIGNGCMFSYGIELRTGDSHSIIDKDSGERINRAKDIVIKDHVWIGAKAVILKGCTVGEESIISIAAVVTKDIPANSIAAGVPATVVKTGVSWLRERI